MSTSQEYELDDELIAIETQLHELELKSLPEVLMLKVNAKVGQVDGFLEVDEELKELESQLGQLKPSGLPDSMLARMVQAMERWEEDETESKVISIERRKKNKTPLFNLKMLKAVAAVALLGGITALVIPANSSDPSKDGSLAKAENFTQIVSPQNEVESPILASDHIKEVSFDSGGGKSYSNALRHEVIKTTDTGIVYDDNHRPHRCIRVDYIDFVKVKDAKGREYEIKTPGVDYMLIPLKIN